MIEIVTSTGVSLDLEKDFEIQVEMEQPLLDSDHLPVAYSTQISFPLTQTNQAAFGYINAMMLEPSVKRLDCIILFAGREIFSGSLVYDGFEDDKLRYIFTENTLGENLAKDIAPETGHKTPVTWDDLDTEGGTFRAPMIIDKRYATQAAGFRGQTYYQGQTCPPKDVKYRNCGYNWKRNQDGTQSVIDEDNHDCKLMPAVQISSVLSFLDQTKWQGWLGTNILDSLYLLLPYGEIVTNTDTETGEQYWEIDCSNYPEAKISDILKNVCTMFCASVFLENTKYILCPGKRIFARNLGNILFWDEKISDIYSLSVEPKRNYNFSLGEDPIDGGEDSYESHLDGKQDGLALLEQDYPERHYRVQDSGYSGIKIYSVRSYNDQTQSVVTRRYDVDIVYRNDGKCSNEVDAAESFEGKCDFKIVHTVPDRYLPAYSQTCDSKAPLIEMPDKNDGRGKDLIVGLMEEGANSPAIHPRVRLASLVEEIVVSGSSNTEEFSLLPGKLYQYYHKEFAEWMGTDRTGVKADLILTVEDLTNLALYKRVNFRGRDWMIKKISLTFRTGSSHFAASGEFISL